MNQILATHNNPKNNRKPIDTKKVIVFFCVAIAILGIIIISVAGYNAYKKNKEKEKAKEVGNPEVSVEQVEEGIKISAKYEYGMSLITYSWNDGDSFEINLNGTTKGERLIDLIENEGENTLKVEVIGTNGRKKEISKTFVVEPQSIDNEKPKIQLGVNIEEGKVIISATDETGLKYLKYQWNDDEPVIIEPTDGERNMIITPEIDIERGENRLRIIAEDIEGNIAEESRPFKLGRRPYISAVQYDNIVEITVVHEMGFKKVEFIINDKVYVYDENYSEYNPQKTTLIYNAFLEEGENVIQVTAESLEILGINTDEGTVRIYKGKCIYTPEIIDTNE